MRDKAFLDTNILVYCFDQQAAEKRVCAREIVYGTDSWLISWQVVQEFCNVALHRFVQPMSTADLDEFLRLVLLPNCRVMPTGELYRQAVRIQAQTQYRFYDSLIVASALLVGVNTLYSEDLQADRIIGDLRIVNPFEN